MELKLHIVISVMGIILLGIPIIFYVRQIQENLKRKDEILKELRQRQMDLHRSQQEMNKTIKPLDIIKKDDRLLIDQYNRFSKDASFK